VDAVADRAKTREMTNIWSTHWARGARSPTGCPQWPSLFRSPARGHQRLTAA